MGIDISQTLNQIALSGTCVRKKVGCLVLRDDQILVEAANGRPDGLLACIDGGCERCGSDSFGHGIAHDLCSCLHAEQRALTYAAREGVALKNSWLYSTYQPCITCLKLITESGVAAVRYVEPWLIPEVDELPNLEAEYESMAQMLEHGCKPV